MSFSQFRENASRKPDLNQDCVYRYEAYEISDVCASHHYPEFDLWYRDNILFKTFDEAEGYMRKNIANMEPGHEFYCHIITVLQWGKDMRIYLAKYLYDYVGELVDYSYTPPLEDTNDLIFLGRTSDRVRFKTGDLVEVRDGDTVKLGIIWQPTPTVEGCWELYNKSDDDDDHFSSLASCDDLCVVLFGSEYDDVHYVTPVDIMPPTFNVEDSLRKKLMNCLEESIESLSSFRDNALV